MISKEIGHWGTRENVGGNRPLSPGSTRFQCEQTSVSLKHAQDFLSLYVCMYVCFVTLPFLF